jgi:2-dehydropantoate 2-reductase
MGDLHTSGMALRFCVIGAGSMGSLHGGLLARAGFDVTLLDVWAEHVDAIRREALRLDGITDDVVVRIRATVRAAEVPPADVALVLTDANATVEAAAAARALLRPEGFAVTLQNGIGNVEALAEALGRARVAGGLSYHSAAVRGPAR